MADLTLKVKVITDGVSKLQSLGGGFGGIAKTGAIAFGALSAGAIAGGSALAAMAIDAENAQTKLENTFKGMNAASFTTVKQLDKQADALAKATIFDDDSIKEFQTTMLTFGNVTGDVFKESVEVGADMAAFFGTDMQGAAVQLGKALNDPIKGITALSRVGVSFTEEQQAQIKAMTEAGDVAGAQAIILGELEKQVGGTATALSETTGGQISQAMEDLGEAGESLGTLLLPVFASLAQGLAGFADFVVANMPIIQGVISTVFGFIGGIFDSVSSKTSGLGSIFQGIVAWVTANLPTIASVFGQVFGAIGNVLGVIAPPLIELAKILLPAIGAAASILFTVLDKVFKGIGGVFEVFGNVVDGTLGFIEDAVDAVVGVLKGIYNAFASFWNSIDITFPSIDVPFFGTIGGFSIGLPDIPLLAKGGIVTKPTLAVIGEQGPEAVVPLGRGVTGSVVNNFTFPGPILPPDERVLVERVERSQRLTKSLAWNN